MTTPEELEAQAIDAATARKLEEISYSAQDAQRGRDEALDAAQAYIANHLGDEASLVATYGVDDDPNLIELCGVKLVHRKDQGLRALVTCPLCGAWDVFTDELFDLADFGALFTGGNKLAWHNTPPEAAPGSCDGLKIRPQAAERPAWAVDTARTAAELYKKLNEAHAGGYRPAILTGPEGFIIVGKRIGDRFNQHYDAIDDDEPFT